MSLKFYDPLGITYIGSQICDGLFTTNDHSEQYDFYNTLSVCEVRNFAYHKSDVIYCFFSFYLKLLLVQSVLGV